ncbi:TPA: tetratricopeptide repeat protein [Legionella pneumophila]|nr:hypothetical protein [Legionella pneumophila]HAU1630318.1 SEL1-like repeat protein [Legionella pneumophila]HCC0380807.1 SEL1-like repeat protein [Legionella pneumophila]HEB4957844.1 SEL1-like repeat protein [Legionella pneumophila]HEB4962299.1 SEL1-like repeat protein [Legionella pneumophila]
MIKYKVIVFFWSLTFISYAMSSSNTEIEEFSKIFKQTEVNQLNDEEKLKVFKKCSILGNRHCSVAVGRIYYAKKEYTKALPYFLKADTKLKNSEGNDYWPASFYLGQMYFKGLGVQVDNQKAIKYLKRLLPEGSPLIVWQIAGAYNRLLPDPVPAYAWLKVASEMGVDRELPSGHNTVASQVSMFQKLLSTKERSDGDKLAYEICTSIPRCAKQNIKL